MINRNIMTYAIVVNNLGDKERRTKSWTLSSHLYEHRHLLIHLMPPYVLKVKTNQVQYLPLDVEPIQIIYTYLYLYHIHKLI
jgi:hypothetical protein